MRLRAQFFDRPGGRQLSLGAEALVAGLKLATTLPGGFKDVSFTLKRAGTLDWPDLQSSNWVELYADGFPIFEGRLSYPTRATDDSWDCQALGLYFSHCLDREYATTTTGDRTPSDALNEIGAAACPLLALNANAIDSNGDWTIDLSQTQYQGIRPQDLFKQISQFGDKAGNIWDVAVWERRMLHYHARDRSLPRYAVSERDALIKVEGDAEAVRNSVRCQYQTPFTAVLDASATDVTTYWPADQSYYKNTDSVAHFGERQITLKENTISASQAESLVKSYLAQQAWEQRRVSISVSHTIPNAHGGALPVAVVRAGQVVSVRGLGSFVIVETDYDGDADSISITCEHGFKRYSDDIIKNLAEVSQQANEWTYGRGSGTSGTSHDINYAQAVHDHLTLGAGPSTVHFIGGIQVDGTKNCAIYEADGSVTLFAALEMELTRFGCLIPLNPGEETEDLATLGPKLVSRLDARFTRNTDGHYALVGLVPVLDGTGAVIAHQAVVFSTARSDLQVQMIGPFGIAP